MRTCSTTMAPAASSTEAFIFEPPMSIARVKGRVASLASCGVESLEVTREVYDAPPSPPLHSDAPRRDNSPIRVGLED